MRQLAAISALGFLVACGDPLADMPRLSETSLPEDSATLSAIPQPESAPESGGSFLERLLGVKPGPSTDPAATPETEDAALADKALPPEAYGATSDLSEPPGERRGGLFGLFGGGSASQDAAAVPTISGPVGTLPYGQVVRVCDLPKRAMGKKVAQYPERRPRHLVYDTDPRSTTPRTFYLTGFEDGCARQFTASVALFGSVAMHEQLRYGLPAKVQPYSDTDKAYERLKSRVCNVPRKKPCGAKLTRLESDTVFLSIYESFGGNERWSNLLLHGGQLLAQDIKG